MEKEYSILIGGRAGDGIKKAAETIGRLLNKLGYWIFAYVDYPSLIRGGHNFAIIRAKDQKILSHKDKIDILIALNQETFDKHFWRLKDNSLAIFDSSSVRPKKTGRAKTLAIPFGDVVQKKGLPMIVRNTAALGSLAASLGIKFSLVEEILKKSIPRKIKENIQVAGESYELAEKFEKFSKISVVKNSPRPLMTGNEAIGLGAVKAGLKLYIAYPMTPATGILHYLAANQKKLNIALVQPENEIGVIGMAQGAAFAGVKTMLATSGGGFALMTEHLSLAGQAEIPTFIVLSQRPAPATGVPTYTSQGDLFFALYAGHGEFPRIVTAPGDVKQAFELAGLSLNLAWKFQLPAILLSDKHLSESIFSADFDEKKVISEKPKFWNKKDNYKRYLITKDGISPLAFPGMKKAVVKSNSYEHDEFGITTEESELTIKGQEKRLKKIRTIEKELKKRETVKVYGNLKSKKVLTCWGSTTGTAIEAAQKYNLKVVQPLFLEPFPVWELKKHLKAAEIINLENNSFGQLARLLKSQGFKISKNILKYDGRPFTVDELEKKLRI